MKTTHKIWLTLISCFLTHLLNAQSDALPDKGSDAYRIGKLEGRINPRAVQLDKAPSFIYPDVKSFETESNDENTDCLIPFDPAVWSNLPANDDDFVFIPLQFDFNFYGETYQGVYLNNNGNLTFDNPLEAFSASSFPITTPMIAPFWGDVDTRGDGSGIAWYLSTPTALYVYFDQVGYYNENTDKSNTFQVVITDGADPVLESGNNAAFYYGDMQWTTGDFSNGIDGFEGIAATVGVNSGNANDFFQIGRFSQPGDEFISPSSTENGIDWLDNKCFEFNLSNEENFAPVVQSISSTQISGCPDDTIEVSFIFTGPEADQIVLVSLEDGGETNSYLEITEEEGQTSGILYSTADVSGDYILLLIATDNGTPIESTTVEVTFSVAPCVPDCLGELDGTALPNTPCISETGAEGIWTENCDCAIEAVPCDLSFVSFEELTDGCEDEQPMLDLVFDLTNPNASSEGTLIVDYSDESIDDEEIIVEVPVDGGEFSQMVTLESYGVMVTIELIVGEGDEQCSAASSEIDLPIPECVTDCEGVVNGSALPGTPCNVTGISGFWNENCECIPSEPGECENYRYFLADNPTNGGDSKLYEYTLDEENSIAELEEILSLSYPFHIAYDGNAELVYIVRSANGNFRTLDVSEGVGDLSEEVVLSETLANAVATGFDQNGVFYIGSQADGRIYTVDRETGMVTFFRNAPVEGGDLAFRDDGNLYLATRDNNGKVYELNTEGEVSLVQNVPPLVTGMAITENGNGLVSVRDRNRLYLGDDAGNQLGSYLLVLDGEVFTSGNGDMASGCKESELGSECDNFVTYYTGYPQNGSDNELFAITLNEDNTLDLTQIEGFSTADNHIAVSPDGLIYAVRGNSIDIFNPATASYAQQNIPIETASGQSLSGFPAATFDLNGILYIAKSSNNTVYSIEIAEGTAIATIAFSGVDVSGGDLIATGTPEEQILWLINRSDNTLTNLLDNSVIPLELTEINGACLLEDGRLLLANGMSSEGGGLYALDLEDFSTEMLSAAGGPDVFFNGDLASGCISVVAAQNFVSTAQSVVDLNLNIAPNPTESVAFISYSTLENERMSLEVLDLQGRVVEVLLSGNQDQREGRIEFDGSALTNGIYLVRLISGDRMEVKKLIVSH